MTNNKQLSDLVNSAITALETTDVSVDFQIEINGMQWTVYSAYIGYREITLNCDEGTCTFFVDSYGDNHYAVLHEVTLD